MQNTIILYSLVIRALVNPTQALLNKHMTSS